MQGKLSFSIHLSCSAIPTKLILKLPARFYLSFIIEEISCAINGATLFDATHLPSKTIEIKIKKNVCLSQKAQEIDKNIWCLY